MKIKPKKTRRGIYVTCIDRNQKPAKTRSLTVIDATLDQVFIKVAAALGGKR